MLSKDWICFDHNPKLNSDSYFIWWSSETTFWSQRSFTKGNYVRRIWHWRPLGRWKNQLPTCSLWACNWKAFLLIWKLVELPIEWATASFKVTHQIVVLVISLYMWLLYVMACIVLWSIQLSIQLSIISQRYKEIEPCNNELLRVCLLQGRWVGKWKRINELLFSFPFHFSQSSTLTISFQILSHFRQHFFSKFLRLPYLANNFFKFLSLSYLSNNLFNNHLPNFYLH